MPPRRVDLASGNPNPPEVFAGGAGEAEAAGVRPGAERLPGAGLAAASPRIFLHSGVED